jgi:hypothetical protein
MLIELLFGFVNAKNYQLLKLKNYFINWLNINNNYFLILMLYIMLILNT